MKEEYLKADQNKKTILNDKKRMEFRMFELE